MDKGTNVVVLKIRQPKKAGGGAGAMWQEDKAYTLATSQDMTVFIIKKEGG